jgi:hypothetical protein
LCIDHNPSFISGLSTAEAIPTANSNAAITATSLFFITFPHGFHRQFEAIHCTFLE